MFPEESLYDINQEIDFFSLAFYVTNNSSHFKSYINTLNVAYETNMERAIVNHRHHASYNKNSTGTHTDLKFGPTMRTEEEGVGPDLVAMLERVRLLVALILDDNKQPGHQRRQKQQRFAVSRIFDAAHNCEATAADVLKDL